MDRLNYHHLRLFHEVANDGNLTRTAKRVNLSQSAISSQIRTLEQRLGHDLFERVGRRLKLTEVGLIVLDHADRIFGTGHELMATLDRTGGQLPPLRVGAISTLSRNFQLSFLQPAIKAQNIEIVLRSGPPETLLEALESLALDVVLATEPAPAGNAGEFMSRRIAQQTVGLHGGPERMKHSSLVELLSCEPLILPTDNTIKSGFETLVAGMGVTPHIVASVDDMAMVRLLARDNVGVAIAPAIVLADEIADGRLQTAPFELDIVESFFAVTVRRSFPHPALEELLPDLEKGGLSA